MKQMKTLTQSQATMQYAEQKQHAPIRTSKRKLNGIKRITPFLMLSVFLMLLLFPYIIITHGKNIDNAGFKLFLIPFIAANTLYLDVALWKYYEGKNKAKIWIFETIVTAFIMHWLM